MKNSDKLVGISKNKTITLSESEIVRLRDRLITIDHPVSFREIENRTIGQDIFTAIDYLPRAFADLVFVDPPYNLSKTFNGSTFKAMEAAGYEEWLDSWMKKIIPLMKPSASLYICGDWKSSGPIFGVAGKYLKIRNRITFEREKGRGARSNWKNCSEDIWFCTVTDDYYFNVEAVKVKRKVLAPYKDGKGKPKDWKEDEGGRYRITYPSNIWTDITIPFWSMGENTVHPTQKPEKLAAKIILASSRPGDVVFDPFLGSGTTSVVAKKLGRRYVGVEIDELYGCLAEKRLAMAELDPSIQGYMGGLFWDRNTLNEQLAENGKKKKCTHDLEGSGSTM